LNPHVLHSPYNDSLRQDPTFGFLSVSGRSPYAQDIKHPVRRNDEGMTPNKESKKININFKFYLFCAGSLA